MHIINRNKTLKASVFVAEFRWLVLAWLACRVAADLVICFTMTSLLRARRTGFKQCVNHSIPRPPRCVLMPYRSDTALSLMVLWTINTGIATAASSVVNLVIVSLGRCL